MAVFIAQRLVGASKQLKQVIQIEYNIINKPNWPKANKLAIYKLGQGFIELGAGYCEINPGGGQNGTRIKDHWHGL